MTVLVRLVLLKDSMRFPGPDDLPAVLLSLRLGVSDPEAQGPLQALRVWEKLGKAVRK